MAMLELDVHTWRALALLLPDPTAFAACCKRASQVVGDDDFRIEWFSAYHRCVLDLAVACAAATAARAIPAFLLRAVCNARTRRL
jgi:hypothetical protein